MSNNTKVDIATVSDDTSNTNIFENETPNSISTSKKGYV